jgi:hypothetical protein
MKKLTIIFIAIFGFIAQAQVSFTGTILVEEGENSLPLEGANVYFTTFYWSKSKACY